MTQRKKSKTDKKKLTDVKCLSSCGNCGFFFTDDSEEEHCINIEANREYDMDDISEHKTCSYYDKDGYECEDCGNEPETDISIFIVEGKTHKHIFCDGCLADGINDMSRDRDTKMDLSITVIDINSL